MAYSRIFLGRLVEVTVDFNWNIWIWEGHEKRSWWSGPQHPNATTYLSFSQEILEIWTVRLDRLPHHCLWQWVTSWSPLRIQAWS